jgi:hypothetical protein
VKERNITLTINILSAVIASLLVPLAAIVPLVSGTHALEQQLLSRVTLSANQAVLVSILVWCQYPLTQLLGFVFLVRPFHDRLVGLAICYFPIIMMLQYVVLAFTGRMPGDSF